MRTKDAFGLMAVAGAAAAILLAPAASADPGDPTAPVCSTTGDNNSTGPSATECSTPGDVEITATAPDPEPVYAYPWDDEFYGPALIIGGGDGPRGGGGRR